jgi:hypothetical protein
LMRWHGVDKTQVPIPSMRNPYLDHDRLSTGTQGSPVSPRSIHQLGWLHCISDNNVTRIQHKSAQDGGQGRRLHGSETIHVHLKQKLPCCTSLEPGLRHVCLPCFPLSSQAHILVASASLPGATAYGSTNTTLQSTALLQDNRQTSRRKGTPTGKARGDCCRLTTMSQVGVWSWMGLWWLEGGGERDRWKEHVVLTTAQRRSRDGQTQQQLRRVQGDGHGIWALAT